MELSDDLRLLRDTIRDFAIKEIKPIAREVDEEERVPIETIKKAGEMGLLGVPFPEKYSGAEAGVIGYCLLQEEINRYCAMPGQACAYKIGHTVIARLRAEAAAKRGFNLRTFHDQMLVNGSLPLSVLEDLVRTA